MVDNETEAANFLDRLDIDVNDLESRDIFESRLIDIFSRGGRALPTDNQTNILFEVAEKQFLEFPQNDIRRIEFTSFGREQTRFVLPNRRGLFNFQSALDFLKELSR